MALLSHHRHFLPGYLPSCSWWRASPSGVSSEITVLLPNFLIYILINLISPRVAPLCLSLPLSYPGAPTRPASGPLSRRRNCCARTTRRSIRTTNTSRAARNPRPTPTTTTTTVEGDHRLRRILRKYPGIRLSPGRARRRDERMVRRPPPLQR